MTELVLSKYKWAHHGNVWFSGFIIENDLFLREEAALQCLQLADSISHLKDYANTINGSFSIIIKRSNQYIVITDKQRSIPVFFKSFDNNMVLTDDADYLVDASKDIAINDISVCEFQYSGYSLNFRTLIKDIFITEPYSIVVISDTNDWTGSYYYRNKTVDCTTSKQSESVSAGVLKNLLHKVFKRFFSTVSDKTIAIPLSGGYDSRLVATMAKLYHKGKVFTYTYGVKDNCEIENAKKTAERLGFEWVFIEYNRSLVHDFFMDETFNKYYQYVSYFSSSFWLQDYFAVKEIKRQKLVPNDCVFVPGLSGDAFAGSHLLGYYKNIHRDKPVLNAIRLTHFNFLPQTAKTKDVLSSQISCFTHAFTSSFKWQEIENWDLFQRQPKFIACTARVYTFFGYNYYLPFWDNDLMSFFQQLSFDLKLNKRLYNSVVEELFKENKVFYKNELQDTLFRKNKQAVKEFIKQFLPSQLIHLFSHNESIYYYEYLTSLLLKQIPRSDIVRPKQLNFYNAYIVQWYIFKVKELIKTKAMVK